MGTDLFDKSDILVKVMDSIKANQAAIDAITLKLNAHLASLASTVTAITAIDENLKIIKHTIDDTLLRDFDTKLDSVKQDPRNDFSTTLQSFGHKVYPDLSTHHMDTTTCFKTCTSSIACISDDV